MICATCRGGGSLFVVQSGKNEWWNCPSCDGDGVRCLAGPPTIHIHNLRLKKPKQDRVDDRAGARKERSAIVN